MDNFEYNVLSAIKANLETPPEVWQNKPFLLFDYVLVDDYAAYHPTTGLPTRMRQMFLVEKVENGRVTEVRPNVLNYPVGPIIMVRLSPQSRIRHFDVRFAKLDERDRLG